MINIVLYEPEIPFNTGAAIRLCANMGFQLHLIEPIGFDMDDKKLRRTGLDYHEFVNVQIHPSLEAFHQANQGTTVYACTTHGRMRPDRCQFKSGDTLLFGPETRGLPKSVIAQTAPEQRLRIPMQPQSRSLNLANSIAILAYEAWRQLGFSGSQ